MTGVTLRAATGADAPRITEVFLAARRPMTYLPHFHTDDQGARFIFDLVASAQVRVAVKDRIIIGFAAVRVGWLEHVNVHPAFQSAGVGSQLIGWAKETSPMGLNLWVFQRNTRAQAFYVSHGWLVVAMSDGDNEEGQPDVQMRWAPAV
jgi:GNAT superfamily N-acetyltransferase